MALVISISLGGITFFNGSIYITNRYLYSYLDYIKSVIEFHQGGQEVVSAASFNALLYGNQSQAGSYEAGEHTASVPVLLYHRVVEEPDGFNITRETFKDQMFALKREGFETVSLENLLSFLKNDKKLPAKSIIITFDDGAKDSFYPVDPIIRALDYRAVNFIITGHSVSETSRDGYYLNLKELKAMVESGRWEIGSHTAYGHGQIITNEFGDLGNYLSNRRWLSAEGRLETEQEYSDRIHQDLLGSKKKLEEALGVKPLGFAFPYGDYGYESTNVNNAVGLVKQNASEIFSLNFYQPFSNESVLNIPEPGVESYYVKRIDVNPNWSGEELIKKLKEVEDEAGL